MGAKTTFALINEPENWFGYLRTFEEKVKATLLASIKQAVEKQLEWQKGVPSMFPLTRGTHEGHNNDASADMTGGLPERGHHTMAVPTAIPAEVAEEIVAHVERARKESRRFVGRADELAEAMDVLFPQQQQQQRPVTPKASQSAAAGTRGPIAVAAARSRLDMAGATTHPHTHIHSPPHIPLIYVLP